jgi:hypothetical protein
MTRGEHIWEEWEKAGNPKLESVLMSSLQRSYYSNLKTTEVNMGTCPGSSEEVR